MDTIRGLKSESMGGFSITGITMVVMVIAAVAMVVLWPPGKTTVALPIEQVDEELVAITNKISKAFSSNAQRCVGGRRVHRCARQRPHGAGMPR